MDKGRERFGGSRWQDTIPTKPRSRSVPDVADTKFAVSLLAKQLIKCRRLPRGFFWNSILPALVFDCSCFRNEVGFFVCYEYFTLLFIVIMRCVFYRWEQTSGGREVFQKKPLGRRWHLMSSPDKGCEFSTATSGTERERGFVGIGACRSAPLWSYVLYYDEKIG